MTDPQTTTSLSPEIEKEIAALVAQVKDISLKDTDILLQQLMAKLTIKNRTPEWESRVRGFLAALRRKPGKEDVECAMILSDEGALDEWLEGFKKTFGRRPSGGAAASSQAGVADQERKMG